MKNNEWQQLQSLIQKVHNKKVRGKFKGEIEESLNGTASRLKRECLVQNDDSAILVLIRMLLFKDYCSDGVDDLTNNIYGIPVTDFIDIPRVLVQLKFQERPPYNSGNTPKMMYLTYPIDESLESINQQDISRIKNKIDNIFDEQFTHYCGVVNFSYKDERFNKYYKISANNRGDAISLFSKVCNLMNIPFKDNLIRESKNISNSLNSGAIRILGENYKQKKGIKTGKVYLKQAILIIGNYKREFLINRG